MAASILNDKTVKPNDELIFSIIGDKELLWKQTFAYLYDHNKNISGNWNFYNDGKSWLFKALKKKKTIFWIRILEDTFRIAFWFGDKVEPAILESNLPESMKTEFLDAKRYGKIRSVYINMKDASDLQNVKMLIDLKLKN